MRWLAAFAILMSACAPPRRAAVGGECVRNSECNAPLVCRIGFCRNECATSADCPAGLSCLLDGMPGDAHRFGACQLDEEAMCTLQSECPEGLVCRFHQCTNACEGDRDCPGGARCDVDPAAMALACIDPSSAPCTLDSECSAGEFCLSGRCRRQCYADRDCRRGWWCDDGTCRDPSIDGGSRDAGLDAPEDTATGPDVPIDADLDGGRPSACPGGRLENVAVLEIADTLTCAAHGVALTEVACWGQVQFMGPLFGGAMTQTCARSIDVGVPIEGLAVTDSTVCVLSGGAAHCWGSDTFGELGLGTGDDSTATVTAVPGVSSVVGISGSMLDSFVAWNGTTGFGWGRCDFGSLGDGSMVPRENHESPITVTWPSPVFTLVAGETATAAILDEGTPTLRLVGRGFTFTAPTTFPVIPDVLDATVGSSFACALTATGVSCFGQGTFGQLGDGLIHDSDTPVAVVGLPGVPVDIDAGAGHACARMADGEVWCWGYDSAFTSTTTPMARPTPSLVFEDAVEVEGGAQHTCVRTSIDTVQCIGSGGYGIGAGVLLGGPGSASEIYLE